MTYTDTHSSLVIYGPDAEGESYKVNTSPKINRLKTSVFIGLSMLSLPVFGMYDGGPTEGFIEGSVVENTLGDIAKHPAPILAIVGAVSYAGYRCGLSERRAQALGFGIAVASNAAMEFLGGYMEHKGISLAPALDIFRSHEFRASDVIGGIGIAAVGALAAPPFISQDA